MKTTIATILVCSFADKMCKAFHEKYKPSKPTITGELADEKYDLRRPRPSGVSPQSSRPSGVIPRPPRPSGVSPSPPFKPVLVSTVNYLIT